MCGYVFAEGIDANHFCQGLESIKHRGPDDSEILYIKDLNACLGFNRLAIQDVGVTGKQPFISKSGNTVITFNGEIFNLQYLRKKYLPEFNFRGHSDTEVLVELLDSYDIFVILNEIRGMFSFVMYSEVRKKLYFARDYFGVKPGFWSKENDNLFIGSEVTAILNLRKKNKISRSAIYEWVSSGFIDHSSNTFYEQIYSLPPGHVLEKSEAGVINIVDWRKKPNGPKLASEKDLEIYLDELLKQKVTDALISERGVAAMLSGGVDSQLLYLLASQQQKDVRPYTLDWGVSEYSEIKYIEQNFGSRYTNLIDVESDSIFRNLEDTIRHFREPFTSPFIVGSELLFERVKLEGISVVLNGNGLDEIFYGYDKYQNLSRNYSNRIELDGSSNSIISAIGKKLISCSKSQNLEYSIPVGLAINSERNADLFINKVPRILKYLDLASMRFGVEMRVPFLDQDILAVAEEVPLWWLRSNYTGKIPIRKILSKKIINPESAFDKKRNLQVPMRKWLAGNQKNEIKSIIKNSLLTELEYIDFNSFNQHYERVITEKNASLYFVWQWLQLAIWINQVDEKGVNINS